MSIKPVLSFRSLFIGTIVPILHSVAVFAFGERVLPSMFAETFVADVATDEIAAGGDRESFNDAEPESVQKDDKDSEPLVGADGKLLFEIAYPSTNNNANSVIIAKDPTGASASAELTAAATLTRLGRPTAQKLFSSVVATAISETAHAERIVQAA